MSLFEKATVADLKYIWVAGLILGLGYAIQWGIWIGNIWKYRKYKIHIQKIIAGLPLVHIIDTIVEQAFIINCTRERPATDAFLYCMEIGEGDSTIRKILYYIYYYKDIVYYTYLSVVITLMVWGYGIVHHRMGKGRWVMMGVQVGIFTLCCIIIKLMRIQILPLIYGLCIYSCALYMILIPNQRLLTTAQSQFYEAVPNRNLERLPITKKLKILKKMPYLFMMFIILTMGMGILILILDTKAKDMINAIYLVPIIYLLAGSINQFMLLKLYGLMRLKNYAPYAIYNAPEHAFGMHMTDTEVDRLMRRQRQIGEEEEEGDEEDLLTGQASLFYTWPSSWLHPHQDDEEEDDVFVMVNHRRHHYAIVTQEVY